MWFVANAKRETNTAFPKYPIVHSGARAKLYANSTCSRSMVIQAFQNAIHHHHCIVFLVKHETNLVIMIKNKKNLDNLNLYTLFCL